jgi:SAM-dependent methyltransferase
MAATFTEIEGFRCYAPALAESYADYPSDGFDVTAAVEATSFWCRARNRIIADVIRQHTDPARTLDLLEVGCGIGGVIAATAMPFRSQFDIVGAFDVLEHIQDDDRVISGVRDALRPGGLFVVTVPQYQWMWSPLDDIVCHKRRYSRAELLGKLRRGGYDVPFCSSFVTALFPAMAVSRWLSRHQRPPLDRKAAFTAEVVLPPAANWMCDRVMRIDEAALRAGLSLPFGGSLLAIARKV